MVMATINRLTCPACGGKLIVSNSNTHYECMYCGTQLQISQDMGQVSAQVFSQAAKSMDRAAAEMAIKRLQADLEDLEMQRQPLLAEWERLKKSYRNKPNYKLRAKVFAWMLPISVVLLFVAAINDMIGLAVVAVLVFGGAIIALIANAGNAVLRKKTEADYRKMAQAMIPLEEGIERKAQELARNRQIVEEL